VRRAATHCSEAEVGDEGIEAAARRDVGVSSFGWSGRRLRRSSHRWATWLPARHVGRGSVALAPSGAGVALAWSSPPGGPHCAVASAHAVVGRWARARDPCLEGRLTLQHLTSPSACVSAHDELRATQRGVEKAGEKASRAITESRTFHADARRRPRLTGSTRTSPRVTAGRRRWTGARHRDPSGARTA
jgi:hypothetical protein